MELKAYFGIVYLFLGFIILIFLIRHSKVSDLFTSVSDTFLENAGCVYLSLDRNINTRNISNLMNTLNFPLNRIHKITGTNIPNNLCKGNSQAHARALEIAKISNWDFVVILEDNAELNCNTKEVMSKLREINSFIKSDKKWDVFMLSNVMLEYDQSSLENIVKVNKTSSQTAYIVNKNYYDKLMNLYKYCNENMSSERWDTNVLGTYSIKEKLYELQSTDDWYSLDKSLIKSKFLSSF